MTHTIHLPILLLCACTPAQNDRVPVPPPEWLVPQVYDSLYLVTTWEPCPMCRGAIADEHRLKPENVVVLMPKDDELLQAERTNMERFAARHLYVDRGDIQQDLFCQHPGYRKAYPHNCRQAP